MLNLLFCIFLYPIGGISLENPDQHTVSWILGFPLTRFLGFKVSNKEERGRVCQSAGLSS